MTVHLSVSAPTAGDIVGLINQARVHPRATTDFAVNDETGQIGITVTIAPEQPDPLDLICDLAYDTDEDDAVGCQLLDGHGGVHYHPAVGEFDDNGQPVAVFDPAPVRTCRECGCTDEAACAGGCSWVELDLCSACAETPVAGDDPLPEPDPAPEPEPEPEPVPAPDDDEDEDDPGGASPPLTCADAIVALLETERDVAWSIADIADGITGGYKQATVSFTLGELARSGRITRAGRGLYQAAG